MDVQMNIYADITLALEITAYTAISTCLKTLEPGVFNKLIESL
jgi:hypothetical protein